MPQLWYLPSLFQYFFQDKGLLIILCPVPFRNSHWSVYITWQGSSYYLMDILLLIMLWTDCRTHRWTLCPAVIRLNTI